VSVVEVIQRGSEFLARKGVDSPRLQIELLLAHVLQVPRLKLYLNFGRIVTAAEMEILRGLLRRRGKREPLQHLLGSTSFCGLEILVNPQVLIPRPETELLGERAHRFLHPSGNEPRTRDTPTLTVLDFGTGSGCLAILLALQCPQARIHALDVSEAALNVARQNAACHQVADRIEFHLSDGFNGLPAGLRFDLLVGNPPYVPSAEIETLQPEVRRHDPRLALDGGSDGLCFYRRLAVEAAPFVAPGGRAMLEFGAGQAEPIGRIFSNADWIVESVEEDYSHRPRILIARWPEK
jgi:release factor glutamine methyltransferase